MNTNYFAENGITMTKAQQLCTLAQQQVANDKEFLQSLRFYDTNVYLYIAGQDRTVEKGYNGDLRKIYDIAHRIANANALEAYLKEAMKAKNEALENARSYSFADWLDDNNIELINPRIPFDKWCSENDKKIPDSVTEESLKDELSIKQQHDYLALEALASTLGKFINKGGVLDTPMKKLSGIVNKPSYITGEGQNTRVHTYTPSQNYDDVEKLFLEMSAEWRKAEAALNQRKYDIQQKVRNMNAERARIFDKFTGEYNTWLQKATNEYLTMRDNLMAKYDVVSQEMIANASKLKIAIPSGLKSYVDELEKLGTK